MHAKGFLNTNMLEFSSDLQTIVTVFFFFFIESHKLSNDSPYNMMPRLFLVAIARDSLQAGAPSQVQDMSDIATVIIATKSSSLE